MNIRRVFMCKSKKIALILAFIIVLFVFGSCSNNTQIGNDNVGEEKLNESFGLNEVETNNESINDEIEDNEDYADDEENVLDSFNLGNLQYPSSNDLFEYNVYENGIKITGYVPDDLTGELVIPETIENLPVRIIGEHAFGGESPSRTFPGCSISEVILPDNLYIISDYAFYRCEDLNSISFGENITTIGENAFANTALESVRLPENLVEIEKGIFYECENLHSVTYNDKLTFIDDEMFAGCINLKTFNWGANIEKIGAHSFSSTGFSEIEIPDSVTYIGDSAFSSCDALTEFTFPDTVQEIGVYVLSYCSNLTKVTFGTGISEIPLGTFSDSDWIEEIYFWNSGVQISEDLFGGEYYAADPIIFGGKGSSAADFAVDEELTFKIIN